jgi:hypothetical protein
MWQVVSTSIPCANPQGHRCKDVLFMYPVLLRKHIGEADGARLPAEYPSLNTCVKAMVVTYPALPPNCIGARALVLIYLWYMREDAVSAHLCTPS